MLVPQNRLLAWLAAFVLPFAAAAPVTPFTMVLAQAVAFGFAIMVLTDALFAPRRIRGFSVQLPEVTRLQKDRTGKLLLRLRNDRLHAWPIRIGLLFPLEIATPNDSMLVVPPQESPLSKLEWPCTPSKRGQYFLDTCRIEAGSPLGFWAWRAALPVRSELRVYPNLMDERKKVSALFLNRGCFGIHTRRQAGKGRDFEKLRDYIPGDSMDEIHWKASAKRGRPVTKVFQVERTQEIYAVLDISRLSARNNALERCVTAALILGMAAQQQGDIFGLLAFSDHIHGFARARNGRAHFDACRDLLYTLQPRIVTPNFEEAGSFIRLHLRKRTLLFFLTALDDPVIAANFGRGMDLIRRQHLIMINMLKPEGVKPLFSNQDASGLDSLYQSLGGHVLWHNLRDLGMSLKRQGIHFSLLDNEHFAAQLLTQYLDVKASQLL